MDFEADRLEGLTQARDHLTHPEGETLEARFGPGSTGYHELLDRAYLMAVNWETFIATHPAALLDPVRYARARDILSAMHDFYQLVGRDDLP